MTAACWPKPQPWTCQPLASEPASWASTRTPAQNFCPAILWLVLLASVVPPSSRLPEPSFTVRNSQSCSFSLFLASHAKLQGFSWPFPHPSLWHPSLQPCLAEFHMPEKLRCVLAKVRLFCESVEGKINPLSKSFSSSHTV